MGLGLGLGLGWCSHSTTAPVSGRPTTHHEVKMSTSVTAWCSSIIPSRAAPRSTRRRTRCTEDSRWKLDSKAKYATLVASCAG